MHSTAILVPVFVLAAWTALVLLLIAVIIALGLILSSLLFDRRTRARAHEERGHR